MASRDLGDRLEGKGWLGWTIGAVVLAPVVVPALGKALRPVAKEAIKGFFALSEKAREMMAETGEQMQDLIAEAKAEYSQEAGEAGMMNEAPGDMPESTAEAGAAAETTGEQEAASPAARGGRGAAGAEPEAV